MEPDDLFEDFDPSPAPCETPVGYANIGSSSIAGQSTPLPPSSIFNRLRHECLASIDVHALDRKSFRRIEQVMRECVVDSSLTQSCTPDIVATAGTVAYFQSYVADYAGEENAMAAACAPRPVYERLMHEALPLRGNSEGNDDSNDTDVADHSNSNEDENYGQQGGAGTPPTSPSSPWRTVA